MRDVRAWHLDEDEQVVCVAPAALWGVALEERQPPTDPVAYHGRQGKLTHWWSSTTGTLVVCGSKRRTYTAAELDFDPGVSRFAGEPVELHWAEGRIKHRWRPDFITVTRSGVRQAVVLARARMGAQWHERLAALQEVAAEAGWQVQVREVPHGIRRDNLLLLADYRQPAVCDRGHERALLAAFGQPRPLCEGVADSGVPDLLGRDHVYRLIWRRRLRIDWDRPLLPISLVWKAGRGR
ncbi:TnsA-like heteromeric transposase endonuclease subunit [Streptomyces chrestomyceticus]|uniref:TnsA-like heteromeric transposase endonuclease subunit n=1 Tax=Streptomyces chrestomyceticus TaxID=68185 RepID=UPI00367BAAE3